MKIFLICLWVPSDKIVRPGKISRGASLAVRKWDSTRLQIRNNIAVCVGQSVNILL